jgi:hypothetical protein
VSAGGTFSFNGTPDQTESALGTAGFTHYFGDNFDPFHLSTRDYRAVDYRSAGTSGTGAGSGHFTVHEPWGESNPYTGGLIEHTKQVFNNLTGSN